MMQLQIQKFCKRNWFRRAIASYLDKFKPDKCDAINA